METVKKLIFRKFGQITDYLNAVRARARVKRYVMSGRKPWTTGYNEYKEKAIGNALRDQDLLKRFMHNRKLPTNYGFGIDERVIEYGWVLSRLAGAKHYLMDAGSTLNYPYILDQPAILCRSIVVYNITPGNVIRRSNVSYIYGDLKRTILRSECFDEIVCISVLEHIGMNNTFLYSKDPTFNEFKPDDYQTVIREFKRLLKPGGKLFITVPYGRYENHGWLQQFDYSMIEKVCEVFNGSFSKVVYYKYFADGWQVADADTCAKCSYFDIHNRSDYEHDFVAAARAIACIEMIK